MSVLLFTIQKTDALHHVGVRLRSAHDQSSNSWSYRNYRAQTKPQFEKQIDCGGREHKKLRSFRSALQQVCQHKTKHFNFYAAADTSVSIGSKMIMFGECSQTFAVYDVDKDEWYEESFQFTEGNKGCICLKVPKMSYKQ